MMKILSRYLLAFALCVAPSLNAHSATESKRYGNSVGFGLGLHYGVIGVSYDRRFTDAFSATTAVGYLPFSEDVGYTIGLKWNLRHRGTWRPRLSLLYGTNALAEFDCTLFCGLDREAYTGFTLSAGQAWFFGSSRKHGVEFDLSYIINSFGLDDDLEAAEQNGADIDEGSGVKASLGYRVRF